MPPPYQSREHRTLPLGKTQDVAPGTFFAGSNEARLRFSISIHSEL